MGIGAGSPELRIVACDLLSAEAVAWRTALGAEEALLYADLGADLKNVPGPPQSPSGRCVGLQALVQGTPAGGVALLEISAAEAEVRHLYVLPTARRRGVARALLAAVEQQARQWGCRRLRLETGDRQQPALALYASAGFVRVAPFAPHLQDPVSVCLAKPL